MHVENCKSVCCCLSYMVAELVVNNKNMVVEAETFAQLLEVVGATHEEIGGSPRQ